MSIKKGTRINLRIDRFADQGKSVGRVDGLVVLVEEAVPGDRVRARVDTRKKNYAEAHVEEILEASALRTTPHCVYADTCGGCTWQHVDYEAQLEMKEESVRSALVHNGGFDEEAIPVRPIIGADDPYYYRNNMEFSFSAQRWLTRWEIDSGRTFDTDFALGLHAPGRYDKVIDLNECHLQSPLTTRLVNDVRRFAKERDWEPWNVHEHMGYLRHLTVRTGTRSGDVLVDLCTFTHEPDRIDALADHLREAFPAVTTFVNTINTRQAKVAVGDETHVAFGPGTLEDRIGRFTFEIGPHTFFQTNTRQAERLYEEARSHAGLGGDDLVFDLYCGAGTLSLFLADEAGEVVGIESEPPSVELARRNAEKNGVENVRFYTGRVRERIDEVVETHGPPDVVICDPPRPGLHKQVARLLQDLEVDRFVYVSCNPQTQARDLKRLKRSYEAAFVQPVDQFPHTPHIETVALLRALA